MLAILAGLQEKLSRSKMFIVTITDCSFVDDLLFLSGYVKVTSYLTFLPEMRIFWRFICIVLLFGSTVKEILDFGHFGSSILWSLIMISITNKDIQITKNIQEVKL